MIIYAYLTDLVIAGNRTRMFGKNIKMTILEVQK
jgi:hypothetical protein